MTKDPGDSKKANEAQAEGKETASSQQPVSTEPSVASGGTTPTSVDATNGDIGGKLEVEEGVEEEEYDPHYEPIIHLPLVDTKTLEEDEETLWSARAKLFRYLTADPAYGGKPEWKEKGVGEIKFLKHTEKGFIRLLMRRDQTLKLCANHYVYPKMTLRPYRNCDRTLIYATMADFSEEESKSEVLAIRFKTPEVCRDFAAQFENAKKEMTPILEKESNETSPQDQTVSAGGGDVAGGVAEGLAKLDLCSAAGDKATTSSRQTFSAMRKAHADDLEDEYGVTLHQWQTSIDGPMTADDTAK